MQLSWNLVCLGLIASGVHGAPVLKKRIAQNIPSSTTKWEQACIAAGGGQQCNPVSVTAFSTLLAAPGPCAQQDAADQMIDLAKQLKNDAEMIRLTQIFVQQPRNTPSSESVPYCQQAPKNAELNGLFQCQFAGAKPTTFVGGVAVGQAGTIPFGRTTPLSPAGSCPANPSGPITDGSQLVDIVQNPGVDTTGAGTTTPPSSTPAASAPGSSTTSTSSTGSTSTNSSSTSTNNGSSASNFKVQNGKDAQALNAKFSKLTADSACSTGDQACIGTGFSQCVGGKFVTTACAASTACFALPLVNSPGTSIACTTEADATARFEASGATGGITGNGAAADSEHAQKESPSTASSVTTSDAGATSAASDAVSSPASSNFHLQNGKDAQALNAKFTNLNASAACTTGDLACINGAFAQCDNGKFVITSCGPSPLTCAALPLVNKAGTSITCTTEADAAARIAATGATGGITGA
ncbi:hypothetical protein DXG01_013767 [Tephrocybe rancida]|nr:hypothetical protein DXG01_013767 [Tephrocybe rancida]